MSLKGLKELSDSLPSPVREIAFTPTPNVSSILTNGR